MWETPASPASSRGGVKSGTVSPFHPLHGPVISTALYSQFNFEGENDAVRKALDRLHAHWDWLDVIRCLSAALAGMVRIRSSWWWDRLGLAKPNYRQSHDLNHPDRPLQGAGISALPTKFFPVLTEESPQLRWRVLDPEI
jgi:hypothetical protein